jgi:HSP20 family protein
MQTYYWNPWPIFNAHDLDRGVRSSEWPAFEIADDDDATTLIADVPGMTEDDIEVIVTGSLLTVRGQRRRGDGNYVRSARWYGVFERRFQLPEGYDLDAVTANVTHGVLTIRLAKAARLKPRRIKLTSGLVDKVKGLLSGDKAA